jgi:gamma-glutamyltranspeptidase/glutathione hydrolase
MIIKKFSSLSILAMVLLSGFLFVQTTQPQIQTKPPTDPRHPLLIQGPKAEAVGDKVMVSTQSPIVTEACLKVLRNGGNAVDAAITSVFLQHVVEYHQVMHFSSMAGLYYEASTGKYYAFNAVADRPLASRGKHGDPNKVAIGGTVRGLEDLWKRFGTRSWASYLEPAITAAEEGVLVTTFMYTYINWYFEGGSVLRGKGDLAQIKEAREFYMPNGFQVPVGHMWKMPKLAEHLRKLASEGADYMYTGEWGQKYIKAARGAGGRVTMEDMTDYNVRWTDPLKYTYKGYEILTEPPPIYGAMTVACNLNILENFDLKSKGFYWESPDTLEIMARTYGRVSSEMRWLQDPVNFHTPVDLLLSKDYGRMGAEFVRKTMLLPGIKLAASDPNNDFPHHLQAEAFISGIKKEEMESCNSNATVIVDAEGNWITLLHTGHGGTPGVFIDVVRASGSTMRACTMGPGRRLLFPSVATIILKEGKPWMALGTPGSPPQPATEVLVNILEFGMHPKDAADAPRFWAFRNLDRVVEIESRITPEVRKAMPKRGIKIKDLIEYNWHTGSFQIVWRDTKTGKLHGVTDPRRLGNAGGY